MKAANPEIKIGAIGPHAYKGVSAVGWADQASPADLASFRQRIRGGAAKRSVVVAIEKGKAARRALNSGRGWWEVVAREAGNSFDFAVTHRYQTSIVDRAQPASEGGATLSRYMRGLRSYIESRKGRPIELAVTEWNTPKQLDDKLSQQDHALEIAEQFANYADGGVSFALYWPLRMKGQPFALLDAGSMDSTPSFEALALASRYMGDRIVKLPGHVSTGPLFVFASTKVDKRYSILIINKAEGPRCVKFNVPGGASKIGQGEVFSGIARGAVPRKLKASDLVDGGAGTCIPGKAIAGLDVS